MANKWHPENFDYKFEEFETPYSIDAPWPCMRGDIRNSGQLSVEIGEKDSNKPLETVHFRTGNAIFSTPVIGAGDKIYVGSADHVFYAFDPFEKKVLWSHETGEIIDCAACIDPKGNIYLPAADAKIYAYDSDGNERWVYDILHDRPKHQLSLSTN